MRTSFVCLFALLGLLVTGCDKSGVHPLGRVRDTLGPCQGATTTWIRSTDVATEIFLVGEASTNEEGAPVPGCFARAWIEHNSATRVEYGSWDGTLADATFTYAAVYDFRYQPELPVLERQGSERYDYDPPLTAPIIMQADGQEMVLTYSGEARRLTNLLDVIDMLDPTTQEGTEDLMRMYDMPLFFSQTRLLGFGASGMTQYAGQTATFVGTIANLFTVRVEDIITFMPKTYIDYVEFEDLTNITIDGEQRTTVDFSGNGTMEGILTFRMNGRNNTLSGTVDYKDLILRSGFAAEGEYLLTIDDGGEFRIPYTLAADADIRGLLPVSTP